MAKDEGPLCQYPGPGSLDRNSYYNAWFLYDIVYIQCHRSSTAELFNEKFSNLNKYEEFSSKIEFDITMCQKFWLKMTFINSSWLITCVTNVDRQYICVNEMASNFEFWKLNMTSYSTRAWFTFCGHNHHAVWTDTDCGCRLEQKMNSIFFSFLNVSHTVLYNANELIITQHSESLHWNHF